MEKEHRGELFARDLGGERVMADRIEHLAARVEMDLAGRRLDQALAALFPDFSRSRLVELADYTQRSFLFRLAVRSAKLFAPIL